MVSGKPYISVARAPIKAEKAPKERQSRDVFGPVKLKAKRIKISELIITADQRPYADKSFTFYHLRDCVDDHRGSLHVLCAEKNVVTDREGGVKTAEHQKDVPRAR